MAQYCVNRKKQNRMAHSGNPLGFFGVKPVCSILVGCLLVTGCERKPRVGRACTVWQTENWPNPIHGINDGSAYIGRYAEGAAFIISTDVMSCGFPIEATWDKAADCAKYAGYVKSTSSPRMNVECYVAGRMQGSMTIDRQQYDLANGSLFLISFRSPEIRVAQIDLDIYAETHGNRDLKELVENVPEIRAFFEGTVNE